MKQIILLKTLSIATITIILTACGGGNGSNDDVSDTTPPNTNIISSPSSSSNLTSATFLFTATETETEVSFECSLDTSPFVACDSPMQYTSLAEGNHNFRVQAISSTGKIDPSPASYQWNINIVLPSDPLYSDQWHLKNTKQVGEDINVEPIWNRCADNSCRGEGVRIAVVDNGLELTHEDLAENIVLGKNYNYTNNSTTPSLSDHGTSVAGIIAARDLNNIGVRGVAPRAEIVGYDLLNTSTSLNEANAMTRDAVQSHVSNNSWGVSDGLATIEDSSLIWRTAINTGHTTGRNGLGLIYVWAAGNGHPEGDNSNYDGYANYRGVISVGAVTRSGQRAFYSEQGANLLVSAPGGEACTFTTGDTGIATTDLTGLVGYNSGSTAGNYTGKSNYTNCFSGTSAAAPIVSGVVALILQANPNLGWRDVHAILARSARQNDPINSDWQTNGAGLNINHNYGFGVVDAEAAVLLAEGWTNLGIEKKYSTPLKMVNQPIGDNSGTPVTSTLNVIASNISNIEFIEIKFSASDHDFSGDLEVTLTNQTTGTSSHLAKTHWCDPCTPYNNWRFGSTRHLGENSDGDWILTVEDKTSSDTGTFKSWQLIFYGT